MWRNQAGVHMEVPFLPASFHGTGRYYAHYHRRKLILHLTQVLVLQVTIMMAEHSALTDSVVMQL